jgi:hypothetical protein
MITHIHVEQGLRISGGIPPNPPASLPDVYVTTGKISAVYF